MRRFPHEGIQLGEQVDALLRRCCYNPLPAIPPFGLENWAVTALGGILSRTQLDDRGIDGRISPP